jgi:hypothetical protein
VSADKIVNIQKIIKQFKQDIVAHPKKAIVLGIVMVVGLFFWMYHLWGWINKNNEGPNSSSDPQVAITTSVGQTNSAYKASANNEKKLLRYSWKEVLKSMNNDPRTRPAQVLTLDRDPFQARKETIEKPIEEQEVKAPPVSPTSLGMALTSTLIGANGGKARIGGRTYSQGQTIEAMKEGRNYKFVLSEIHDRKVVLEMEGERFELCIPEPGTSSRMVLGTIENKKTGR